ncbi:MAG TPA: hypothetical protein VJB66_04665 [Candidatus Nanoarchaeia archaeon]|nr:hypothetical protein [Candidatus Nanoarchaeia archaeon]
METSYTSSFAQAVAEKHRITRTLERVKKERIADSLKMLDKKYHQLSFLHDKLTSLGRELSQQLIPLHDSLGAIRRQLAIEHGHYASIFSVYHSVKKFDNTLKHIRLSRMHLAGKEQRVLNSLNLFVLRNKVVLQVSEKKLLSIINVKKNFFEKSTAVLNKESQCLFADTAILDNILKHQREVIQKLGDALHGRIASFKKMAKEYHAVLKKQHSFARQIAAVDKKRSMLKSKLTSSRSA